jgi:exosortase D (VPLPA-CTERM-specific)
MGCSAAAAGMRKLRLNRSVDQKHLEVVLAQSRWLIVALAVSIALALALYALILGNWIVDLETDPSYSFALLLPFVAGYLGYIRVRREGRSADESLTQPDTAGVLVVLGGCALLVVSDLTTIVFLSRLSFLVVIAGLTIAFLGRVAMRSLAFPYGILFFGLPLPALIYLPLTFQLQLLSSLMAAHMLQLIGISVLREGNVLILQNISLEVVEACAGLHSLFALGALACVVGYLFLRSLALRGVLFISAIPIAIGLNAGRITSAAVAAHIWGPRASEGFAHALMGVAVFAIGTLIILFISGRLADADQVLRTVIVTRNSAESPRASATIPVFSVIAILLVTFAMHRAGLRAVHAELLREPFASFPRDLGNWHGRDLSLTESQFSSLGTRDVLMREYSDDRRDPPVLLHVAFYPLQRHGSTMHSPLHCIPGSGWEVERRTLTPLHLGESGSPFDVNEVVFRREDDRILVVYWYLEQGAPQASEFKGAFQTMWNSATAGRSYGCLIRFSTPITTTTQDALSRSSAFVAAALPILTERFLPAPL